MEEKEKKKKGEAAVAGRSFDKSSIIVLRGLSQWIRRTLNLTSERRRNVVVDGVDGGRTNLETAASAMCAVLVARPQEDAMEKQRAPLGSTTCLIASFSLSTFLLPKHQRTRWRLACDPRNRPKRFTESNNLCKTLTGRATLTNLYLLHSPHRVLEYLVPSTEAAWRTGAA